MRGLVLTLGCLLLVTGLAGCIGDDATDADPSSGDDRRNATAAMADRANVSEIPPELAEMHPLNATTDDGETLRGHVYLPEGEGPFATVLMYSPYWWEGGGETDAMARETAGRQTITEGLGAKAFFDAGFAFAAVNVRGTGISDGCFAFMNMPQDGRDANAVIDAIADQPWSNGQVGMYGLGYPAATQQAAMAYDPSPHLGATVPISGVTDVWNWLGSWGSASLSAGSLPTQNHLFWGVGAGDGTSDLTPESTCPTTGEHTEAYTQFAATGDKTSFLEQRDVRAELGASGIPTLATMGLDGDDRIRQIDGLWDAIPHGDKHLVVGQWGYGFPEDSPRNHGADYSDPWLDFAEDYAVGWLDHHLRGGPETVQGGVASFQDTTDTWHNSTAWPPADAQPTRLYLSEETMVEDPDQVTESMQVTVASHTGEPWPTECSAGDKALWVSPPLSENLTVAGNVFVNLTVTSTQPDETIQAVLWSVDEVVDGCALSLTEEDQQQAGMEDHASVRTDLAHRGYREQGTPFPIGEPGTLEMRSDPLAEVLPVGKQLVLAVKGGGSADSSVPRGASAQLAFHTGPEVLAELWLPVLEGELAFETSEDGTDASGAALAS